MKHRIKIRGLGLSLALLSVIGCQSVPPNSVSGPQSVPAIVETLGADAVPMELEDGQLSVWQYLVDKYDVNHDGRVTAEECDRDNFERLDRNGDGALTADDYAVNSSRQAMMRSFRARTAVFAYFQADDDVGALEREELSWSFREYDENLDGMLTGAEFQAIAGSKWLDVPSMFDNDGEEGGEEQSWQALLDGVDFDADGVLAYVELGRFFDESDNGDGTLEWESRGRATEASDRVDEPSSGPRVGTLAPDFELAPPSSDVKVKLSSFRGVKPVALVFGSYT